MNLISINTCCEQLSRIGIGWENSFVNTFWRHLVTRYVAELLNIVLYNYLIFFLTTVGTDFKFTVYEKMYLLDFNPIYNMTFLITNILITEQLFQTKLYTLCNNETFSCELTCLFPSNAFRRRVRLRQLINRLPVPVSYTHLDVYKRQFCTCVYC